MKTRGGMIHAKTPALGWTVALREGTTDSQVWADTFTGLYHLPPPTMPAPATVLDLGANIGLTAAHYSVLWPQAQIVGVEMDHGNAGLARRNAPVMIVELAVAPLDGDVRYSNPAGEDSFMLDQHGEHEAQARRPDFLIDALFGGNVDFVKMDVEGAEWALIEMMGGDWLPHVRHLLVELHARKHAEGLSSEEMIARMIAALDRLGFDAVPHPPHPQAVFATRRDGPTV